MQQPNIEGAYYFRKTEMVAGFNFSADGSFRFFFSYGAVDRSASGTFTKEGNIIKLQSSKEPGKDFTITARSKEGNGYTLMFTHANKYLLSNILCLFTTNGEQQQVVTGNDGEAHIDVPHCDNIYVQHLLFPDIYTLVKDAADDNNRFTLSLNPSLEQLSFKGIDLTIGEDGSLSWLPNYFMDMPGVIFSKQ